MPRTDFRSPRLFVDSPLKAGTGIALDRAQANYLVNVMRLKPSDTVLVFNGHDGEWRAALAETGRRNTVLAVQDQVRAQPPSGNLQFWFAPLKHARLDYVVQKAVEMGASSMRPVLTRHTQVTRLNLDRMRANVIEAAEQCGILALPDLCAPITFKEMLAARNDSRMLVFCDEDADVRDPVAALSPVRPQPSALVPLGAAAVTNSIAVLIGPEGGFAEGEREALIKLPNVVRLSLGPRILRADTAAVAALALVQAVIGDWAQPK